MERSGSQKALRVISIIEIVFAVLVLFLGLFAGLLGGLVGAGGAESGLTAEEVATSTSTLAILSAIMVVSAVWDLLCGILGIRAANDNQKIMIVWVFALIGVVLDAVGLVLGIVDGSFGQNAVSTLVGLVIDVLLFWIANNIKREAGK